MESRKDQVQAYFFVVGRLVSALMHGRPDPHERPNRRLTLGVVIGVLLALVISGGFGLYGFFKPGGSGNWRRSDAIIMAKETGARYLFLDGQLRPVLNYASAVLALGRPAPVVSVSSRSLVGATVGAPIGIPGAPDAIPRRDRLTREAWMVCVGPSENGKPGRTLLAIGWSPGRELTPTQGLLVISADDARYLVWQGRRYRLSGPDIAVALGYGSAVPIRVAPAWLNPIPAGRDLTFPKVAGLGGSGRDVAGRVGRIGQVYQLRNEAIGSEEFYVLRGDGLVRLSRTAAALMLADPSVRQAYAGGSPTPIQIGIDDASSLVVQGASEYVDGYPPAPPKEVNVVDDGVVCAAHRPVDDNLPVTLHALAPNTFRQTTAMSGPRGGGGGLADDLLLAAGTGVLARIRPVAGAAPGAVFLVSEFGVKFPIVDGTSLEALGYSGVAPVDLPSELLGLLTTGPTLNQAGALNTQAVAR